MNFSDQRLEDRLREALQREAPPEGFAERVILHAGTEARPAKKPRFRLLWPAVSVAATAVLLFSISIQYRSYQEERAGRQTIEALRLVSEELNTARDKIVNQ